jgi:hypothetical protein
MNRFARNLELLISIGFDTHEYIFTNHLKPINQIIFTLRQIIK